VGELERRYLPDVEAAGTEPAERARALAAGLTADGYAATVRPAAGGIPGLGMQLCQGHCPVQHVAREFPELCEAETHAFSRLLGVHVQRLATLAHGEHVCTTHVPATTGNVPASTVNVPASTVPLESTTAEGRHFE
jgi:predicted ArsR family transcriptional regulator